MKRKITDLEEGLKLLCQPTTSDKNDYVDIVAIHGIGAHPDETWSLNDGKGKFINWLNEPSMLPKAAPNARILRYGYQSDWFGDNATRISVASVANKLLIALQCDDEREECPRRPIIFIAHCYGGLVVVKALVEAIHQKKKWPGLADSTIGVLFFGTPFQGIPGMSRRQMIAAALREHIEEHLQPHVLEALRPEDDALNEMIDEFYAIKSKLNVQIVCFYEQKSSDVGLIVGKESRLDHLVTERSGCLSSDSTTTKYPRARNHFKVNKFHEDEQDFKFVRWSIRQMIEASRISQTFENMTAGTRQGTQIHDRAEGYRNMSHMGMTLGAHDFFHQENTNEFHTTWENSKAPARSAEADLEACRHSLSFPDIDARKNAISDPHDETCKWLFDMPSFKDWHSGNSRDECHGVFWIKGNPGAGKSTLMKCLLSYLVNEEVEKDSVIAAYFFNARGSSLEKSKLGMLRSLVYQIVEQDLSCRESFLPLLADKQRKHSSNWQWDANELETFLKSLVRRVVREGRPQRPYILLVDALDECSETEVRAVVKFLEQLSSSSDKAGFPLRVCLSSRHYPHITMRHVLDFNIDRQPLHLEDIRVYVNDELWNDTPGLREDVCAKANGVFMWVVLVVKILNSDHDAGNVTNLRRRLEDIPADLDKLFQEILNKDDPNVIDDAEKDEKRRETVLILQWVLLARMPLKPMELYYAVKSGSQPEVKPRDASLETDELILRFINFTSQGLVEVQHDGYYDRVQFIHGSINDFLIRNSRLEVLDPSLGVHAIGASDDRLADCCWATILEAQLHTKFPPRVDSYLNRDEFWGRAVFEKFPFLRFALEHKWYHTEHAHHGSITQLSRIQRLEATSSGQLWEGSNEMQQGQGRGILEDMPSFLYVLADSGSEELTRLRLSMFDDVKDAQAELNLSNKAYGTPLQAAAQSRDLEVVRLLLDAGADVNAQGGELGNALQAAAQSRDLEVVRLLLDAGADVNAQGGELGNALQVAAQSRDLEVVRLLLDAGADVNAQGGYYGNALQAAAWSGDFEVVRLLLDAGADVNAQGGYYGNALQAAAWSGDFEVVRLLLDAGADVNAQGGELGNALQAAAWSGVFEVVRFILDAGADPNRRSGLYGSALNVAIARGYSTIETTLRKHGAVDSSEDRSILVGFGGVVYK